MQNFESSNPAKIRWESSHVCPKCDSAINLAEIDLLAISTGIVSCPLCGWSCRIEIKIVDGDARRAQQ
jgi:ribosomal protein L37AE/L43A